MLTDNKRWVWLVVGVVCIFNMGVATGTRTIGFFQEAEPEGDEAYLLAIKEKVGTNWK